MVEALPAWPTGRHDHDRPVPARLAALTAATLAEATPTDRNRAVDFYRAAAMAMVAVGHWLGMVVVIDHGELTGGNLALSPVVTWST